MRIRTIKPEFFKHDGIAALDPLTRILFIGLWCLADCEGRLEDRPARIRVEVLPYDKADVDKLLNQLEQSGFIARYESNGLRLIEIIAFTRHQRITGKESETPSRFPEYTGETTEKHSGNNGETPETTGNGRETEGKGKETIVAPLPWDSPDFVEAWGNWERFRKESRKPITPTTRAQQFKFLKAQGKALAIESLQTSIQNGWQGLFQPKPTNGNPSPIRDRQ